MRMRAPLHPAGRDPVLERGRTQNAREGGLERPPSLFENGVPAVGADVLGAGWEAGSIDTSGRTSFGVHAACAHVPEPRTLAISCGVLGRPCPGATVAVAAPCARLPFPLVGPLVLTQQCSNGTQGA